MEAAVKITIMPGINFIKDGRKPQAGPDEDNKIKTFLSVTLNFFACILFLYFRKEKKREEKRESQDIRK